MTKIHIASNGYALTANMFTAQQPKKLAFLFIQGWKGHQNLLAAQHLAKLGYTSLTYDMRGNGESEGDLSQFSRADFLSDAQNTYDYLRRQVGDDTAIGVIGSSFGSYTAVLLSQERTIHCLSLRVPASYPDAGFDDAVSPQIAAPSLAPWRRQSIGHEDNRAFRALHNFDGAVQIVEAGGDEVVPSQAPKNYAEAVSNKTNLSYAVMEGAPHSLVNQSLQASYEQLLTAWVKQLASLDV